MISPLLLAAALALQGALPGPADPIAWESVSRAADGEMSIDPARIRREGNLVRFLVRTRMKYARWHLEQEMFEAVVHDCETRTSGLQAFRIYVNGAPAGERKVQPADVTMWPIETGAAQEHLHRRVCS